MFISRRSHDQVVALMQRQIDDLTAERTFYRDAWTESLGKRFTPDDATSLSLSDSRAPEVQRVDTYWTKDDREYFATWASTNVVIDEDPYQKWIDLYGDKTPLHVAISGDW